MNKSLLAVSGLAACLAAVALMSRTPAAPARPEQAPRVVQSFGKLPLYFIENRGQVDASVAYYVQGRDKAIYFTPEGVTYALTKPAADAGEERGPFGRSGLRGSRSRLERGRGGW